MIQVWKYSCLVRGTTTQRRCIRCKDVKTHNTYNPAEYNPNATMDEDMTTLKEVLSIGKGAI